MLTQKKKNYHSPKRSLRKEIVTLFQNITNKYQ